MESDFSKFHINPNEINEIMKAYKWFHRKSTGKLRVADLHLAYECLGLKLSQGEINRMLRQLDKKETGEDEEEGISLNEFLQITVRKVHQLNMQDDLLALFHLYDLDRKGKLARSEINFLCTKILSKLKLSMRLVNQTINRSQKDEEGLIDYISFVKLLSLNL